MTRRANRTPWVEVPIQVCFEDSEMQVRRRSGDFERVEIVTPVFRLPDGTEFSGRRAGPELRARIFKAAKPKGIV
jgi:hypothetical protein